MDSNEPDQTKSLGAAGKETGGGSTSVSARAPAEGVSRRKPPPIGSEKRPEAPAPTSLSPIQAATTYGPLLLALYFVATTRWGSYLLPGPPYIGDLALAVLLPLQAWRLTRGDGPPLVLSRALSVPIVLLLLLALVTLATGELTIDALRDGAPYLYAVLALFGISYRSIPAARAGSLVYGALIVHLAWYSASQLISGVDGLPTPGDATVGVFELRQDIDGAMIGILAALAFDRLLIGRAPALNALLAGWALTFVLLNQSRASLIAAAAVIGLVVVRHIVLRYKLSRSPAEPKGAGLGGGLVLRNVALAVLVLVAVPTVMTVGFSPPTAFSRSVSVIVDDSAGPTSTDGQGGTGGVGAEGSSGSGSNSGGGARQPVNNGVGTAQARQAAWRAVVDWLFDDGSARPALGVGFGPQYMHLSGADVAFQGKYYDPTVRAVHNFGLNTWARIGLVGMVLVIVIAGLAIVAAIRLAISSTTLSVLDLFASMLVVAIPITALLGVVLESPFGAIPYFWAVGYLSARMVEERRWRPLKLPARLARQPE